MKPLVLACVLGLGLLVCALGLIVQPVTQEEQVPKTPVSWHASLAAYPTAVISLKDPKTEMTFYVESNGRRLVAFAKDGSVQWSVDVLEEAKVMPAVGQPVIRDLRLDGNDLWVTYGKSETAKVQIDTGKTEHVGAD